MVVQIDEILERGIAGERLKMEEGVILFDAPLLHLGDAADQRCRTLHPGPQRTFVIGRNINYTNLCISDCTFCAFHRRSHDADCYQLSVDDILEKVAEMVNIGGTEMLLQGGLNPSLPLSWFEKLFRAITVAYPSVQIHALSPSEILHLAVCERLSVREVLERLQIAGLASIPGGGAEILVDRVRAIISPRKCNTGEWLNIMREAHQLGLPTTATMMYGHVETLEERIEHLERIRALQDETGGFISFIPWPFQPGNTRLAEQMTATVATGGNDFLRMLAISRLYLDNIPNMQSSWVTQGMKIGQLGLCFGANDLGSTMMEEQVVNATGTTFQANATELARQIADLGYSPAQRTTTYAIVHEWALDDC